MKVYGLILCGWWNDRIEIPRIDSRVHQCPHRNLQEVRPDVQSRKIQEHDLLVRGNSHMFVRGGIWLEKHRRGGHLLGAAVVAHPISGLQSGVYGWVYDRPL